MTTTHNSHLLSIPQAAHELGITPQTLRTWLRDSPVQIPTVRIGKRLFIHRATIHRLTRPGIR